MNSVGLTKFRVAAISLLGVFCISGSFSSRFTEIVGETPSQYRGRDHRELEVVPSCVSMFASRPQRTALTV